MYKEIQVAIPSYQKKSIFDYYANCKCSIGDLVKIPFRNKEAWGVVFDTKDSSIEKSRLKEVIEVAHNASFSKEQMDFFKFASYYTMSSIGNILKLAIPMEFASVAPEFEEVLYQKNAIALNAIQREAADFLLSKIETNKHEVLVLDGITGSGKTEVYSTAICKILQEKSNQVLVLLPEIMLTNQFVHRFENIFGSKPDVWHSNITKKEKKKLLSRIISGNARFVIGARSGLFLPFKNLKMIVVDEEHDHSYKQEEGIIYNARDMAVAYGHYNHIPVLLSSATPSIETLRNISIGKYLHVKMLSRYGGATLPKINIVDMSKINMDRNKWISPFLQNKISEYLEKGKQVMLFLNRKGFAPITLCKSCGHKEVCKNCASFLVVHKSPKKLLCHYCGYSKSVSNDCSSCEKKDSMISCGPGVERIQEEVFALWPDVKSLIVTRDSVGEDVGSSVIEKILNKEVEIIIGTQILSKGHHFPSLDLVGVIDADIGLFGADLRASERTFQLLTQVSGRAGRESEGEVVIQTYYSDNPILNAIKIGDREAFYELEMESRRQMNMPPFQRLVGLIISGRNESQVQEFVSSIGKSIKYNKEVVILGPVVAPMSYIRGKHRYRFLVKAAPNAKVQEYISRWLSNISVPSSIKLKIDVDPYNFM